MARRGLARGKAFGDTSPETHPTTAGAAATTTAVEGQVQTRSERLATLTRTIHSAQATETSTVRSAKEQFIRQAGPALKAVRDDELWREGEWASFKDWIADEFGYSQPYAYTVIDAVVLIGILEHNVNTGQAKAMGPVLRALGDEAVRQQWNTAERELGAATEQNLMLAAIDLGFRDDTETGSAIAERREMIATLSAESGKSETAARKALKTAERDPAVRSMVERIARTRLGLS